MVCQVIVDCWPETFRQGICWVQANLWGYETLLKFSDVSGKSGTLCMSFSRHWKNYIYFQPTKLFQELLENFYIVYLISIYILVLQTAVLLVYLVFIKTDLPEGELKKRDLK